jgi:hypothetical protein
LCWDELVKPRKDEVFRQTWRWPKTTHELLPKWLSLHSTSAQPVGRGGERLPRQATHSRSPA